MKIGILTYHFSENYGALFQAYALRHWLREQGCDAEFINYHPAYVEQGGVINLGNLFSKQTLKILFLKLVSLREILFGNQKQKKGFTRFRAQQLGINGPLLKTKGDIEARDTDYDLLICGSDQIWKPSEHFGVDPVYYLDLSLSSQPLKFSYAASFGKDQLDAEFCAEVGELIRKLNCISVRETTGLDVVRNLIQKDAFLVPDPTFLLSDYSSIMKKYPLETSKYVFCYALRSPEGIKSVSNQVASQLNASLYSPHNPHRRWSEIGETVYPCPAQWLDLMNSAAFVITNSFHGTALSILLNKPFLVVGLQGSKDVFNTRVKNLLSQLDLMDRFVKDVDGFNLEAKLAEEIDWDVINHRVNKLRLDGQSYLTEQVLSTHV